MNVRLSADAAGRLAAALMPRPFRLVRRQELARSCEVRPHRVSIGRKRGELLEVLFGLGLVAEALRRLGGAG